MKIRRGSFALLLNLVLLGALGAITFLPEAVSANAQPARARGEYTLIAGRPNGQTTDAIFVLDAANQEMIALKFDSARKLAVMGNRNLEADAKQSPSR
jgi:hypothetical protein